MVRMVRPHDWNEFCPVPGSAREREAIFGGDFEELSSVRRPAGEKRSNLEEIVLEVRRRDDLQNPGGHLAIVPKRVRNASVLDEKLARSSCQGLLAHHGGDTPGDNKRILILATVDVRRTCETAHRYEVLHHREGTRALLASEPQDHSEPSKLGLVANCRLEIRSVPHHVHLRFTIHLCKVISMVLRRDRKVKPKPKYRLQKRAESQAQTRQRIVEATVALHQEEGPLRTTIVAVASRAGVTRPTVYSHFRDERSLFRACAAHYLAANPPPDPTPWMAQADPETRLRLALADIYAYYRQTEAMTLGLLRDEPLMPHLRLLEGYHRFTDEVAKALALGWKVSPKRQRLVLGAVAHALEFLTWRDFKVRAFADRETADLMAGLVVATANAPGC